MRLLIVLIALAISSLLPAGAAAAPQDAPPAIAVPWPEWWADMPPPGPLDVQPPPAPQTAPPQAPKRPTAALLDLLQSWLAANFALPAAPTHPHVELVPRMRLAVLRYRGLMSDRPQNLPGGNATAGPFGDLQAIHAVYDDDRRTIYLPDDWEGEMPADISVLVHEMVHHLQNAAGLKFSCAQEREAAAYAAQARWLEMFGRNLADELGIDAFDVAVRTRCFN